MTQEQYNIISQSLANFLETERGYIFLKPEVEEPFENFQFEDIYNWVEQNFILSKVSVMFANHFPELLIVDDLIELYPDDINRKVTIKVRLKLKAEKNTMDSREFNLVIK